MPTTLVAGAAPLYEPDLDTDMAVQSNQPFITDLFEGKSELLDQKAGSTTQEPDQFCHRNRTIGKWLRLSGHTWVGT